MQPQFLCMGFQKCGTTTMYDLLKQHKDIVLTQDVKEPMYYRVQGLRRIGGKEWYEKRYFGELDPEDTRLRGEINAGLTFTGCADLIADDFPEETKMLFMMRNPVDRAYSAYKYFLALGFLPGFVMLDDKHNGHAAAFDRYVHYVLGSSDRRLKIMKQRLKYLVFSQGNYYDCIAEYLQYFEKHNMKFILFEEFIRDQEKTCREIYDFLGIEDDPNVIYGMKSNEGIKKADTMLKGKLGIADMGLHYVGNEFLNLPKHLPKGAAQMEKVHTKVQDFCLSDDPDQSKMEPGTRRILEKYYRKQVVHMSKLMGRDLREIWY